MKKLFVLVIVLSAFMLFGCAKEGVPVGGVDSGSGDDFNVEFLFEFHGLEIYRFYDGNHARYFSIGNGNFLPQVQSQWSGKVNTVWIDGVYPLK